MINSRQAIIDRYQQAINDYQDRKEEYLIEFKKLGTPEFSEIHWNIVQLKYRDHKKVFEYETDIFMRDFKEEVK